MTNLYSKDYIQKIRNEVLSGKSKYKVAKELGISDTIVYSCTKDIPSRKRAKPINKEMIQKIRDEVLSGKSKYQVAKETGINQQVVLKHTKDLPNHRRDEPCIRGKAFNLLKQLLEQGYVPSNQETCNILRTMKRHLPIIQLARFEGKSVYYLNDKSKLALQSIIKQKNSKIISYQELGRITKIFNINLSIDEKNNILGKTKHSFGSKKQKIKHIYKTISKEYQLKIDDFFGRFLHSEVL
jgi:DNA-binding phage protein